MWGCSEKTPSFALVCGCCLAFPSRTTCVGIYWITGWSASEAIAPSNDQNGLAIPRPFLAAGGKKGTLTTLEADGEIDGVGPNAWAGELCRYRRPIVEFRNSQGKQR